MQAAPIPKNEKDRLEKLKLYRILDTPPEDAFERTTKLVAKVIGVPIALVSLIDSERQWFKSKYGFGVSETPREFAFCAHTILGESLLEVEDATRDPRFADNPFVVNDPSIRFYCGAPLRTPDGLNIGTLCVIDRKPRILTDEQKMLLSDLAHIVLDELELRIALRNAMSGVADELKRRELENEFVSLVSHELRTPLTSIRGSLALLDNSAIKGIPKAATDLIAVANRNVSTLLRIIDDLLDVQKFEAGKMDLDFGVVDSQVLVCDTCEKMDGFAKERGIKIRAEVEHKATIVGDATRLSQALTNLISNAVKFSPSGGEVVVGSKLLDNKLCISVTDKGPGIPDHFRDRIFKKFSQASGENKMSGTGLGLAISKAIVEAHRGTIGFDTLIGRGTTFHVELPLRQSILM